MAFKKRSIYLTVLAGCLFLLASCNNNVKEKSSSASKADPDWSHLPDAVNLNQLKATEFLPTLENPLDENKNSIYAAAFLYAWDSLKAIYKSPIQLSDTNSTDLKLINQSASYLNTLKRGEYSVNAYGEDNLFFVEAFFNKTLPFPKQLDKSANPIMFEKEKVLAFGMDHYDYDMTKFCSIPFYADDNKFILKLVPKDEEHEIILIKGLENIKSFAGAVTQIQQMTAQGEKEKMNENKSWRYKFEEEDIFSIPLIKYNIETRYKTLEGQLFATGSRKPVIQLAYQRTGFILDENGAVVESHAAASAADSSMTHIEKPKPKKMIFDKPFFIMVKRKEQRYPYFMMRVANAELLTKQ